MIELLPEDGRTRYKVIFCAEDGLASRTGQLQPGQALDNNVTIQKVENFILVFTSIVWEAFPFIILGAVIAGFLEEFVPQRWLARIIPRNRLLGALLGALLGLVFPMCECGIIPVMRRLLRKGLPLSTCIAYLLAGPIINPVVILSTFTAFKGREETLSKQTPQPLDAVWMVTLRIGLAYLVAVVTALLVERRHQQYGDSLLTPLARPPAGSTGDEEANRPSLLQRISNVSETAIHDFVDILVFLILGGLLAAFVRQMLTDQDIASFSGNYPALANIAMMILAVVLCLCSEADAFVAASFLTLPSAAKLAFLVLGPMLDLKLYLMYTRVFRPRLIWTIIPAVVIQVFLYTTVLYLLRIK